MKKLKLLALVVLAVVALNAAGCVAARPYHEPHRFDYHHR